jgi:transposase
MIRVWISFNFYPSVWKSKIFMYIYTVKQLDIEHFKFLKLCQRRCLSGTAGYHPRMLLKVLFYAYMNNIYFCRKISGQLQENIHYMWL